MQTVVPAIPASQIVAVNPSVLAAGGDAQDLNGLILTDSVRLPTGAVYAFPTAATVAAFFGANSREAALGAIYFLGFNNSNRKPGLLLFYRFPHAQPAGAFLQGGSVAALTLAQLQALNGALSVTIDGVLHTATINLNSATSFSNAAALLATGLSAVGPNVGSYTGSITGSTLTVSAIGQGPQVASFVGAITGGTLTVTSMNSGQIAVGSLITGSGVTAGTTVTAIGSADCGGVGTYTVNNAQTVTSTGMTAYDTAGALAVGSVLTGTGIALGTYVTSLGTGAGGIGTYNVSQSQTSSSQTITATAPGMTYDSVAGGFRVVSPTFGAASSMTFGTGALATSLKLTAATNALVSQGAAQPTPAAGMDVVLTKTQNFAQFMTTWEPCAADKEAFSAWNNAQNNRYGYAMWDTSAADEGSSGPSAAVGAITLAAYSGTSLIHEDPEVDDTGQIAAFVLGYGASIDFTQTQGRATAAFKSQSGLAPHVFDAAVAQNLLGYGLNFYGDYTTANQAFIFYYNGSVTGPFRWLDSYLNQIWLNRSLQAALMSLLTTARSIPYNELGRGQISGACLDPIYAAVNNGVIQRGIELSEVQKAEVNASAGIRIDDVLFAQGWYLQVKAASATVRAARGSPPITLWYTDGQSVQRIDLASINIQ